MKKISFAKNKAPAAVAVFYLAFALLFAACDTGSPNETARQPVTFTGVNNGDSHTLVISPAGRATHRQGDSYTLTITRSGGSSSTSSGVVVSVTGSNIVLQPSIGGAASFTVSVSGTRISGIQGRITFINGAYSYGPGEFSGGGDNGDNGGDNGNNGSGQPSGSTLTFTGQVWTVEWCPVTGLPIIEEFTGSRNVFAICDITENDIGGSGEITGGLLNFTIGTPYESTTNA